RAPARQERALRIERLHSQCLSKTTLCSRSRGYTQCPPPRRTRPTSALSANTTTTFGVPVTCANSPRAQQNESVARCRRQEPKATPKILFSAHAKGGEREPRRMVCSHRAGPQH